MINEILYKAGVPAGKGRALLLGWSYKPEVGDPRETPAEPLAEALQGKGITVSVWDPHLSDDDLPDTVDVVESVDEINGFDIAILVTAHQACLEIDWAKLVGQMNHPILYDGRRVLDLQKLNAIGWEAHAVGRPI